MEEETPMNLMANPSGIEPFGFKLNLRSNVAISLSKPATSNGLLLVAHKYDD